MSRTSFLPLTHILSPPNYNEHPNYQLGLIKGQRNELNEAKFYKGMVRATKWAIDHDPLLGPPRPTQSQQEPQNSFLLWDMEKGVVVGKKKKSSVEEGQNTRV
jgi:hypothetical protein